MNDRIKKIYNFYKFASKLVEGKKSTYKPEQERQIRKINNKNLFDLFPEEHISDRKPFLTYTALKSRELTKYAKIIIPPRNFRLYLKMFGRRAKILKNIADNMDRVCYNDDALNWINDCTQRESDPCRTRISLLGLAEGLEYLSGLEDSIDLYKDVYGGIRRIINRAEVAAERMQKYADILEREAEKIREYKDELIKNLDYYKENIPNELIDAVFWLGSREWLSIYKMLKEAPERIKAILKPPEAGDIETLYHASVNAKSLLNSGFKDEIEGGVGLGGATNTDSGKPAISFTYDLYIAKEIARSLKEATLIAQGEVSASQILDWADRDGIKEKVIEIAHSTYFRREVWEDPSKRIEHAMAYWFAYLFSIGETDKRFNPVFWTSPGKLATMLSEVNYDDIGVLVADVDMKNPDITYVRGLREYRVPASAVLGLKKIIK